MIILNQLNVIQSVLEQSATIAIIGLSPKPERPSNMVAHYLIEAGYTVFPVNPGHDTLLDLHCYPDLLSIPFQVDIVDIFRRSEQVLPIVEQAIIKQCRAVWMQQGIVNNQAAELARNNGTKVIMDRCIKIDHASLFSKN